MAPRSKTPPKGPPQIEQEDLFSLLGGAPMAPRAVEVTVETTKVTKVVVEPPVEAKGPRIYTVGELATDLRDELRELYPEIMVQGEIADFKGVHRSGHLYCGLKDANANIRMVMWGRDLQKVPFEVKGGLEVIVTGRVDFYPGSGSLQIAVTRMEPVGIGALQLKFEQLKAKLQAEGLFDAARKRKINPINWRIGLVTGRSTAALQDMLRIFKTRFPMAEVFLFHASVQGEKAAGEICRAIEAANRFSAKGPKPLDVLIVGRGGGSYEDLFVFNDENVARALVGSKVPTVSAVGHEIDFTIADFVADMRAATPSHAAQQTVPEARLWIERLTEIHRHMGNRAMDAVRDRRQKIDGLELRLQNATPQKRLELQRQLLQTHELRLKDLVLKSLTRRQESLKRFAAVMDALSPLKVLDRGYSLTEGSRGLVRSIKDVASGDVLKLRLKDGEVSARVL